MSKKASLQNVSSKKPAQGHRGNKKPRANSIFCLSVPFHKILARQSFPLPAPSMCVMLFSSVLNTKSTGLDLNGVNFFIFEKDLTCTLRLTYNSLQLSTPS